MKLLSKYVFIVLLGSIFSPSVLLSGNESLKIVGWDVYADPENAGKTIGFKSFEKEYGVKIEFTPLSNLDDIIEAAESEVDYDLFIISNEGISILHDMGLVKALNLKNLPQYESLHHNLKYTKWGQFDSKVYAVPWAWGPTGLMFDIDQVVMTDSWESLWDKKYKGQVAMWDDVSMIWTTALVLGYKNVYSLTKTQLQAVKKKLFEFNSLNAYYYKGGGDEIALVQKGKILVYNSWYDPSARLKIMGKNFKMIIPKEGAVGMFDSYLLSANSKKEELAHQYINHQITPDIQKSMLRITGLAPSNIETLALLKPEEIRALHLDDPEYFNQMILWDHMPRKNLYEKVLEEVRKDYNAKLKMRE